MHHWARNTDADYAQWAAVVTNFTVASASTMQAITFSYGGGKNGAGMSIAEGGFEPYLSLFDASGNFLASTFFGTTCPAGANTNTLSGQCFDVLLDGGTLAAGNYQIAISAFENLSLAENGGSGTLADGFTGLGNLNTGENLNINGGATTAQGGFEPSLSLFDAGGDFLASTYAGTTCPTGAETNTSTGHLARTGARQTLESGDCG